VYSLCAVTWKPCTTHTTRPSPRYDCYTLALFCQHYGQYLTTLVGIECERVHAVRAQFRERAKQHANEFSRETEVTFYVTQQRRVWFTPNEPAKNWLRVNDAVDLLPKHGHRVIPDSWHERIMRGDKNSTPAALPSAPPPPFTEVPLRRTLAAQGAP
jgi:hypothetical protein